MNVTEARELAGDVGTIGVFLQSIEADLSDPALLLIFADFLEEQGDEPHAYAWRWMAHRGYRPAKRMRQKPRAAKPYLWAWWHTNSGISIRTDSDDMTDWCCHVEAHLPPIVFRAFGGAGWHVYTPTLAAAVTRLARCLQLLREQAGLVRLTGDP